MCDLSAQGTNRVPNVANFALDAIVRSPGSLAQNGTTKRGMESIPWSLGPSIFVLDFSLCMSVTLPVVAIGSRSDSLNGVSTPIYIYARCPPGNRRPLGRFHPRSGGKGWKHPVLLIIFIS